MRRYEKRLVPASSYDILVEIKCDLCHKTTKKRWKDDSFDAVETVVQLTTGTRYPEGGDGDKAEIDICPQCFVDKLIP